MKNISSTSNEGIKQVVALRNRREREKVQLSVAEGQREVAKLFNSDTEVVELYVHEDFSDNFVTFIEKCERRNIAVYSISDKVYAKISYGDRVEGILAVFKTKYLTINDLPKTENSLIVVIEQVEKPGNFGAILRTCDAVGVDGIIMCDARTDLYNPNVIRASIGTVFTKTIVSASNEEASEYLIKNKIKILAASPKTDIIYSDVDLKKPTAIVLGSEDKGLSDFWLNCANKIIKIPMLGEADSLNVSTSTAILLYEIIRQRQ